MQRKLTAITRLLALVVAVVAMTALIPGVAAASPAESEGCKNIHRPGEVYQQRCVGVSSTGSASTAQARANSYLTAWENAFSVRCRRDSFQIIPRDGGKVQVNLYATCFPFA